LPDIKLLGTEEHIRLAERAAHELVAGLLAHVHDLVVALRSFIPEALDLAPIPNDVMIPLKGPTRPSDSRARRKAEVRKDGAGRGGDDGGGSGATVVSPMVRGVADR
jgi:hypothetical protein